MNSTIITSASWLLRHSPGECVRSLTKSLGRALARCSPGPLGTFISTFSLPFSPRSSDKPQLLICAPMDHDTELVKADIARRIHQQQLPPTASPVYDLPHLPLEIWGQFLLQLDDPFTLWVTCRRISRRFKLEAEHAFRMAMLPHLQMAWSFGTPLSAPRFEVKAELSPNVKLSCHEDNTQIAGFTFSTSGTADPNWALTFSKAKCAAHAAFAINYKDINLRHRDKRYYRWGYPMQFPYHSLCVSFTNCYMPENCYVNDPETEPIWIDPNDLSLEKTPSEDSDQPAQGSTKAGSIFFNWHALLNVFFTEIVFVARHLNRPPNPFIDFTSLLAKAKNNITSQCKYLRPQADSPHPTPWHHKRRRNIRQGP
jgi:hypothetical protein